jgi:hypothetical protein
MVKRFFKRLATGAAKAYHGPARRDTQELPIRRLLAIWMGSALIIATGYMQPPAAAAALLDPPDDCFVFDGWFQYDAWCEWNPPTGMKSCGRCEYLDFHEPPNSWYAGCMFDLESCVYIAEEEECGLPSDYCDWFIEDCEGLDTCIG